RENRFVPLALGVFLILGPYCLIKLTLLPMLTNVLAFTFQGIGFTILLLQSIISPSFGLYRCLNFKWVCWIGVLSYSIYIWQQIFCSKPALLGISPAWWLSFPGWLVPVFLVSIISFYGLERPLLALRARFRNGRS